MARLANNIHFVTAVACLVLSFLLVNECSKAIALRSDVEEKKAEIKELQSICRDHQDVSDEHFKRQQEFRQEISFLKHTLKEVRAALVIALDGREPVPIPANIPFVGK